MCRVLTIIITSRKILTDAQAPAAKTATLHQQHTQSTMSPTRCSPEKQDDQESDTALAALYLCPLHFEISSIIQSSF
ncbi:hypothetical protein BDR05DRAFT_957390 [Suillus weaverae]|nr:hypothetical protein BDR05DRAFT_957390 [Suillus weaverae]